MSLNTYLFFDGNCREAFEFYRSVFGGEFSIVQTFGDGPPGLNVPESEKDRIMHVSLPIGSAVLMGSDSSSAFGPPPVAGDNFAISLIGESREHCDDVLARLSEGGTVTMPMQGDVLGRLFRHLAGPVRHQLDDQLRPAEGVGLGGGPSLERPDDLLPGLRHLAIGRVICWFDVDDERQPVRVLAVFFGGQDHVRHMLARLLQE